MFRDANPNVSSYESHPASGQLATHSGRNNETDPTNDKISLNILLSNDGLVQMPLEPLQQGQRISMQPPKSFKSEGLEGDRRLLTWFKSPFFFFFFSLARMPSSALLESH
jgi:hypothetical protein